MLEIFNNILQKILEENRFEYYLSIEEELFQELESTKIVSVNDDFKNYYLVVKTKHFDLMRMLQNKKTKKITTLNSKSFLVAPWQIYREHPLTFFYNRDAKVDIVVQSFYETLFKEVLFEYERIKEVNLIS